MVSASSQHVYREGRDREEDSSRKRRGEECSTPAVAVSTPSRDDTISTLDYEINAVCITHSSEIKAASLPTIA